MSRFGRLNIMIAKLICKIFGHKYNTILLFMDLIEVKAGIKDIKDVRCPRCGARLDQKEEV